MMKRLAFIWLSASISFLGGCSLNTAGEETYDKTSEVTTLSESMYQKITVEQAKEIIDGDEPYVLLDVRTDEEFKELRIEGAILIPDYEIGERADEELTDKDARILVYCRSGRRSALAAKELVDMGYTNVLDFGGIIDWPYETIKD